MRIMGIDINPGSSPANLLDAKYSVVILDENGNIVQKFDEIGISKIIRLAWEYEVSIVATDNIYELGENDRQVIKIISLFPDNVELVQVTYNDGRFMDIREVAKNMGIEIQGKPNPSKTAYLAAYLALKGAGTKIKLTENKTKIIISRGRHLGPGGMSSNRYKRHIRGLILRVFKEVKETLDRNNIDYDVILRRSKSGLENATFIVYAPRERLYGLVKKMSGHDVNLEIRPVYKTKIDFETNKKIEKKPIIVGIDPGIFVGISAIDIHGNPVILESKKGIDREEIINKLSEKGSAIIIATDVNPVPDAVKKIAGILKAKLYVPDKSLSVDEKQKLLQEYSEKYNLNITDPHIRDSLAAALKAYKELENKLSQASSTIRKLDLDIDEYAIYKCIIEGKTVAECIEKQIENEIAEEENKEIIKVEKTETKEKQPENKTFTENSELKHEIFRLRRTITRLLNEKYELEKKLYEIKTQFNAEVERDRRLYRLKTELEERNKSILKLQEIIKDYSDKINKLEGIINDLVEGKVNIIKSNSLIEISDYKVRILGEEVNPSIFNYVGKDFIICKSNILDDIRKLSKEKEIQKEMDINDIKNIIEEYRRQKSKHGNFAI
ncbi:DUF460 domain-containing protein [Acidianus ambivalens]|uniref:DUF460 domain-containing protein n=1 Tax=Acidianus ambivalens TaxID=2283 RepID=A0A650CX56_ACIAM|nr:DUF460 domain-containing protein [Acidianus ambivalens]MQL54593.1 DUF460 domain-containing protein [Acidianus ambivalens]QGR22400.1 DUF460 domain-containing protein [Acidianus ambivalens]